MPKKSRKALALFGASGRMGREILRLVEESTRWSKVVDVARKGWEAAAECDVVVDFTSPKGLIEALDECVKHKLPLVSGTTGLSKSELKKLSAAGKKIPLLWSANMSVGIHTLVHALKSLEAVREWDFLVEETHHRMKKDKPSGTALFLQNKIKQIVNPPHLAEPLSIRSGGVIGVHRIIVGSMEEVITFEHEALSRAVFARGALRAAEWLAQRRGKPRQYEFSDVLLPARKVL